MSNRAPDRDPVDYVIDQLDHFYVFSSPMHSGTTYRERSWTRFCTWQASATHAELQPISTQAIETWLEAMLACRFAMIKRLKAAGFQIVVVEPPRPLLRTPGLLNIKPDILLAADAAHRSYVTRWLEATGIPIVCAPERSHCGGFTLNEYSRPAPDPHHGNALFGEQAMAAIIALCSGKAANAVPN